MSKHKEFINTVGVMNLQLTDNSTSSRPGRKMT